MPAIDISDINMEGVKPAGEYQELGIGQYLVRIEDTEKKVAKDKFDAEGKPMPDNGKNFYLQFSLKVYGGPNADHVEFERLNLWNSNATAVNIAKSTLESIFVATGAKSNTTAALIGKWLMLEVKAQRNGELKKHYSPAPADIIAAYAPSAPALSVTTAAPQADLTGKAPAQASTAQSAAAPAVSGQLPSWAAKK